MLETINNKLHKASQLGARIFTEEFPKEKFVSLDLSTSNKRLMELGNQDAHQFNEFIFDQINLLGGTVGHGGYFEERRWYQKSAIFDDHNEPRDIHLGLDLWVKEATEILCPLDGRVHSFKNNAQFLDYGPTIILEHDLNGDRIFSLYGHLSVESLEAKLIGQEINSGEVFASIGDSTINGNWPPHLHLQLILDMQGMKGDFPGVCAKSKVEMYKNLCPDPRILLGL